MSNLELSHHDDRLRKGRTLAHLGQEALSDMLLNMSAVIFDFDGTIADSYPVIIDVFRQLTKRAPLPPAEVQRLRQLPLHDLSRELRLPKWQIPFLLWRGRRLMRSRVAEVKIFPGIEDVIKRFHSDGHQLFVVSSNSRQAIELFLKHHKLDNYFVQIYGSIGLFSKAKSLAKVVESNHIDKEKCYYIGDEVRDIEAALKVGIKQVAVTWGYNDVSLLKAYYPTALVSSPAELTKVIK